MPAFRFPAFRAPHASRVTRASRPRLAGGVALAGASLLLGGCVFESPYWAQTFANTGVQIPIQTWTNSTTNPVQISCAKAFHGGLVEPVVWTPVASIAPAAGTPAYDTNGAAIYPAGRKMTLPASCWHADNAYSPPKYMTALRARQNVSGSLRTFEVFSLTGLSCVGRWNGAGGSWYSYMSRLCPVFYSGTTTPVDHVRVIANALGNAASLPAPAAELAAMPGEPTAALELAKTEAPDEDARRRTSAAAWQHRFDRAAADAGNEVPAARLRAAWDRAQRQGTRLVGLECRSGLCRVELLHDDAAAEARFLRSVAGSLRFRGDGTDGHVDRLRHGETVRATYFLTPAGEAASGAGAAAAVDAVPAVKP